MASTRRSVGRRSTAATLATTLAPALAVALAMVLLVAPAPALAHNRLVASDPEADAQVAQAPGEVRLTFLAALDPDGADLSVTGPDGESAQAGSPEFDGTSVDIPIEAALAGEYEVAYEVLSTDGHRVDGTLTFTVTEGEPVASPSSPPAPATTDPRTSAPALAPAAGADQSTEAGGGLAWWVWALVVLALIGGAVAAYRLVRRRAA